MIPGILNKLSRPALISLAISFGFATAALAGSLTPPGIVASTMHSLQELYDSIAGTFDSTAIVANENGSLVEHLKFIEENMGSGSGVSSDSLDFDEFVDSMTLDGDTTIASDGFSLTTDANTALQGNVAVGGANFGDLFGSIPGQTLMSLQKEFTDLTTAGLSAGTAHTYDLNPGATPTDFFWGENVFVQIPETNTENFSESISAAQFYIAHYGTGTVSSMSGLRVLAQTDAGPVTNATGILIDVSPTNAGTMTNAIRLDLPAPLNPQFITNNYGIRIGDQSGSTGEHFNLLSLGATSQNKFEGSVTVDGDFTVSGTCTGCSGVGGSVSSDSLDFDEFVDSMNLDANTSIASQGFTLTTSANVGIASLSPNFPLDVGGDINTSGSYRINSKAILKTPNNNVFLGYNAGSVNTTGPNHIFIGTNAGANTSLTAGATSIGIGSNALLNAGGSGLGYWNIAIGASAALATTTGIENIAIGRNTFQTNTTGNQNITVGATAFNANISGSQNVALGHNSLGSNQTGNLNVALGDGTRASGSYNTVLGASATLPVATINSSILIGYNADGTSSHQLVVGSNDVTNGYLSEGFFGSGVSSSAPFDFRLRTTSGLGSNIAGSNLRIAAGQSTGTASGGSIIFQTATSGLTGSTTNPLLDRLTITPAGNFGIASSSPGFRLAVEGSFFASSSYGSGLTDCDNATTSKLLWDATTGRFSCGTDQTAGGAAGALELIESHDFTVPATSFTFSGLDGNADGIYVMEYTIVKDATPTLFVTVRPNGITTNQETYYSYFGFAGPTVVLTADLRFYDDGSALTGHINSGHLYLYAKTGVVRMIRGEGTSFNNPGTLGLSHAMTWNESTTNITSLEIVADHADGIGAGSFVRLYKVNH